MEVCEVDLDCTAAGAICINNDCVCSPWYQWTGPNCDQIGGYATTVYSIIIIIISLFGTCLGTWDLIRYLKMNGFKGARTVFGLCAVALVISHFFGIVGGAFQLVAGLTPISFGKKKVSPYNLPAEFTLAISAVLSVSGAMVISILWIQTADNVEKLRLQNGQLFQKRYTNFLAVYVLFFIIGYIAAVISATRGVASFFTGVLGILLAMVYSFGMYKMDVIMHDPEPSATSSAKVSTNGNQHISVPSTRPQKYDKILHHVRVAAISVIIIMVTLFVIAVVNIYTVLIHQWTQNPNLAVFCFSALPILMILAGTSGIWYLHAIVEARAESKLKDAKPKITEAGSNVIVPGAIPQQEASSAAPG